MTTPRLKYKDVTIEGHEFRIGLVPAVTGDWVIQHIGARTALGDDVYPKIQTHLLNVCSVYRDADGARVPQRVYADGKWLIPGLELDTDLEIVSQLVDAAWEFNFIPFLEKQAAKKKASDLAKNSDTIQPTSPTA